MDEKVSQFIKGLKAAEQARQEKLAQERQQRAIQRKAFDLLRLEHIDALSDDSCWKNRDVFYLIFWPSRYYDSDSVDKNNLIYKAAYEFYRNEPLPELVAKSATDYFHKGDEVLQLVYKNDWNTIINGSDYSVRYWTFLEKICPDFLRPKMERLKKLW